MKLRIGDQVYDVVESMRGSALGDLRDLMKQTAAAGEPVTVKTIQEMFTHMGEQMKDKKFTPLDLLTDDEFLRNMIALVWLARRKEGETITLEDAAATPFTDISLVFDADEEDEDSPKDEADESPAPSE